MPRLCPGMTENVFPATFPFAITPVVGDVRDHLSGEGGEGPAVHAQGVAPVEGQPRLPRGQPLQIRPEPLVELHGMEMRAAALQEGAGQDPLASKIGRASCRERV